MARSARADILRTVVSHPRPSPVSRLDVATPGSCTWRSWSRRAARSCPTSAEVRWGSRRQEWRAPPVAGRFASRHAGEAYRRLDLTRALWKPRMPPHF